MNPREEADQAFDQVAEAQLRRLEKALGSFDPDEVEADIGGDVLTPSCGDGTKIIINRHRAARQIWMAAMRRAWHFDPQPDGTWKTAVAGEELVATLEQVLSDKLGRAVSLPGAR